MEHCREYPELEKSEKGSFFLASKQLYVPHHCLVPGHQAQSGEGACDEFATNQDLAFKSTGSKKNRGTVYL